MKRVLSLLVVLALVLVMVPAVFAATSGSGAEDDPYVLEVFDLPATFTTEEIPAGSVAYYNVSFRGLGTYELTVIGSNAYVVYEGQHYDAVNGVVTLSVDSMGTMTGTGVSFAFQVGNSGDAAAAYDLKLNNPVGSWENPKEMDLGDNTVSVEADDFDGYNLTWTAPASGTVTITMVTEEGWAYSVNSSTVPYYGDYHYSDDPEVVRSETLEVSRNDVIEVNVNTNDPSDWSHTPAGTIVINLDFVHVHEMTYQEAVEPGEHTNGTNEYWYCEGCDTYFVDADGNQPVARKSLVIPALHAIEYHEEVPATEHTKGMQAYWYCADCDDYFAADDVNLEYPIASKTLTILPEHTIEYHEAVPAGEHTNGMQAYWYCVDCDDYFAADDVDLQYPIASKTLVVLAEHADSMEYHAEVPAGEHTTGMKAYWYCAECDTYYAADDTEFKYPLASKELVTLPEHSLVYHPAVAADEHTNGMQAYWYCEDCDTYYAADDTEFKYPVASKTLVVLAEHADSMVYHAEVPATATENGMRAYWYCAECDTYYAADDTEFKYPIASKTLVILATGETDANTDIPKTGDNFSLALVSALILASGMGVAALAVSKKKFF